MIDAANTKYSQVRYGIAFIILSVFTFIGVIWMISSNNQLEREFVMGVDSAKPAVLSGDWAPILDDSFDSFNQQTWAKCYWWYVDNPVDGGCNNEGNQDLQWSTPANTAVGGGELQLRVSEETVNGYDYTSGMIASENRFSFNKGYIEFDVKFPSGTGVNAFLGLMPEERYKWPPEVFIAYRGESPNQLEVGHFYRNGDGTTGKAATRYTHSESFELKNNRVAIWWESGKIRWYVNDQLIFTSTTAIPDEEMYIMARALVGGKASQAPAEANTYPTFMNINYINVWQQTTTEGGESTLPAVDFNVQSFNTAADNGPENVDINIPLRMSEAHSAECRLTANVTGGSATRDIDYSFNSDIRIPAGQTSKDIVVEINDDLLVESDESFALTLSNPINCVLGSVREYTYTINDNDGDGEQNSLNLGADWNLTFFDDFNATELNENRWTPCYWWYPGSPDGIGCKNGATGEEQWYMPDDVIPDPENSRLRLRAQRREYNDHQYTSGMIASEDKFWFTYGYAEIRVKMPRGQGLWPAFWALWEGREWPPELDVFENHGDRENWILQGHFFDDPQNPEVHDKRDNNYYLPQGNWYDSYNTLGILWEPGRLRWFVNGTETFESTTEVPDHKMYLLANLAVGGPWAGSPDETTPFPSYLDIDYIKVWQKDEWINSGPMVDDVIDTEQPADDGTGSDSIDYNSGDDDIDKLGGGSAPDTPSPEPTCLGDYNRDQLINDADFKIFEANYKRNTIDCGLDLVGADCELGINDFRFFGIRYDRQCSDFSN